VLTFITEMESYPMLRNFRTCSAFIYILCFHIVAMYICGNVQATYLTCNKLLCMTYVKRAVTVCFDNKDKRALKLEGARMI
jgi:hypothetical protein